MRAEELFDAFDELDAELLYDAHAKPQRKQYVIRHMAIAASFVLLIAVSFVIYGVFVSPASHIYLDSREHMTVTVNSRGRVLSVNAASGRFSRLNGMRIEKAASELIAEMVTNGSINRDENTLIIGADNLSSEDRDALFTAASDTLAQYDFAPAVITVTCHNSNDTAEASPAIRRMIDLLCDRDSSLDRRALSKLCVNDLALLWADSGVSDPDIAVSGKASDSGHIGFDAATAKALGMSSFDQAQIDDVHLSYSVYNGRLIYVVRFNSGDRSEAYFINAATGTTEQALKMPSDKLQEAVDQEIKTSNEPLTIDVTETPQIQQQTEYQASPTGPAPTVQATVSPTEAESADYGTFPITMKELSFVVQSVPETAEPVTFESLFGGQCFYTRNGEKQNAGIVAVISSYTALQKYLADHAYPYLDRNGRSPMDAIDKDYFNDHCILAVSGVFSDASYDVCITELKTDGSDLYLETSLSYGESRSGEYYSRALSLYGVEKSLSITAQNLIIY